MWGAYSVSKAALDHLARVWASEVQEFGIRMLSVDPGEMDTAMHAAAVPDADPQTLPSPAAAARSIVDMITKAEFETHRRLTVSDWGQP